MTTPRPLDDHQSDGDAAYWDGAAVTDCPHDEGTLAYWDWRWGYFEAQRDSHHDPDSDGWFYAQADLEITLSARKALLRRAERMLPPVAAVGAAIGVDPSEWAGRCHEIAVKVARSGLLAAMEAEFGPARATYGVYDGEVLPGSMFYRRPVVRHGWIEFASGLVLDPTRFAFGPLGPHLWVGSLTDYDLGANRLRRSLGAKPCPDFDLAEHQYAWDVNDPAVTAAVEALMGNAARLSEARVLTRRQAHWLANLPPETLGEHASAVYAALQRMGARALVPRDNWDWVMGDALAAFAAPAVETPPRAPGWTAL